MEKKVKSQEIFKHLRFEYPDIKRTALGFISALDLLIATILSAQCTDKQVNKVTKILFKKFKTPEDYAKVDLEELENIIKSTGFYHRKARFIKLAAEKLIDEFNSQVPASMEKLTQLPGVARKTANIVLSNVFNINEGIAVDTHVMRLSKRLRLTEEKERNKIEKDLMNLFNQDQWPMISTLLIAHGRNVCTARHPKCKACTMNNLCPSAFKFG
ncbi:MAG: endonuclease III [Candidatus Bathyarchaeota archaeon]